MLSAKQGQYLHLHLIVFIWGFTAVLGALISLDAIPLVAYRMSFAAIFLFLFAILTKKRLRFSWKVQLKFAIAGLLIALHWLAFFGAVKVSNVSVTLAVMSTGAFFAAFLEPIFLKRKLIIYEVVFGLLAMCGLALIFKVESQYTLGILLALGSSFLGACFTIYNAQLVKQYQAGSIGLFEMAYGALFVLGYLTLSGAISADFFVLSSRDWIYVLVLASVCTAYAFVASVHVMRWLSAYTVMLTVNLEPVYGILLGLWILGDAEHMQVEFYLGAALILLTVIANGILKLSKARKRRSETTG